jgi:IclR family KDG regulon transcriptional repressor
MEILNLFKKFNCLTLQEIVFHSEIPKSSAHRMACSLESMGFLQRNEDGSYSLGLLFLEFGHLVAERIDVRRVAYPIMEQLKNEIGEAVNLVIKDGDEALYIEKVETSERVRVYTQIGRRAPLYAGACPRILLTYLSKEQQDDYLSRIELVPYGVNTITDRRGLLELLATDRKKGYTVSHSELEDYSSAVGAPILNFRSELIAGISIVGPEVRFRIDQHLEKVISCAVRGAKEISRKMGWKENE